MAGRKQRGPPPGPKTVELPDETERFQPWAIVGTGVLPANDSRPPIESLALFPYRRYGGLRNGSWKDDEPMCTVLYVDLADFVNAMMEDEGSLEWLPQSMAQHALWARRRLKDPDSEWEFGRYEGDGYVFAVKNQTDNRWYDVAGHWHHVSPTEYALSRTRRLKQRRYLPLANKLKEEILCSLTLSPEARAKVDGSCAAGFNDLETALRHVYTWRRRYALKECHRCGETRRKLVWHHLDGRPRQDWTAASAELEAICCVKNPDEWQKAYRKYAEALVAYYDVPLEATELLCRSCHGKAHAEMKRQASSSA